MNRSNLNEVFEQCLTRLHAGVPVDQILAEYPQHAAELRPLLMAAEAARRKAKGLRVSTAAQAASRQQFLNQAAVLRQQRSQPWWSVLSFLRANLGTGVAVLAAIGLLFLAMNTVGGLTGQKQEVVVVSTATMRAPQPAAVLAVETAQPTQTPAPEATAAPEQTSEAARPPEKPSVFDVERVTEVVDMQNSGQTGDVKFTGYLEATDDGGWQLQGVPLLLSSEQNQTMLGMGGARIKVKGFLNASGQLEVQDIQAAGPILLGGTIEQITDEGWIVDGVLVKITESTQIEGQPGVGNQAVFEAAVTQDEDVYIAITAKVAQGTFEPKPSKTPNP